MIRRFCLALVFLLLTPFLRAAPSTDTIISGDTQDLTDTGVTYTGHAVLKEPGLLLTADTMTYDNATDVASARGHVVFTRGPLRILADRVVFHRRERTFTADGVRLGTYPYYIEGESASGSRDEVTVNNARITFGEPGPWQPTARAAKVVYAPGRRLHTEQAQVGIGHAQPLPFPKFEQSLADPLIGYTTLTGGFRSSLGAFVDAGLHLPVAPGVRLGGDVGYYTARGILAGPSGTYSNPNNPDNLHGLFRSGYINDHGDKKTDVLGDPVPEHRAFVEWQHQQVTADDLALTAQFNWWRDSEVVRDFRPRVFFPVQQPDTFAEATKAGANYFISVFARFAPNSFEVVQQRTPEIRFDLLPLAVGNGFYERFSAGIAMLHERPVLSRSGSPTLVATAVPAPWQIPPWLIPPDLIVPVPPGGSPPSSSTATASASGGTTSAVVAGDLSPWTTVSPLPAGTDRELRSTRFDAYYGLMRPITPREWMTVTPVAGGRLTHYMNTRGAAQNGRYTRALGELGLDAEVRSSGTFAYKNEAWKIDGLRHLFTPRISYRYIPEADDGRARIPAIDRETFSTYLQPLGLGDVRNVDDLHATNTLRLALNNTLQTRDPQFGSRDLLVLNVANEFRFKRARGERDVSEIHTELAALPARWLEFGLYSSFAPQSFTLRELNSGVTIRDGNAWSVRFANNFLRNQLEDYVVDGRVRLTEAFEALTRLRYDQRAHRFNEQAYGLVQNLANTWSISYVVSLYSGPRRESHFGFSVQIDTVRF